jgi:predicted Fe-S protein YdhL (DUF1289 family)
MESPCNKVCAIDAVTGWCLGCGRTLDEIAAWSTAGEATRRAIIERLAARLAELKPR